MFLIGLTQGQLIDLDGGSIHVHREPHGVDRGIGRGRGIGGFVDDIGRGRGRGGFVEDIGRGRGGLGGLLDNVIGGISQAIGGIGGGRRRRRPRICYRRGEIPAHDRYGNVEWCSDRYHYCQDPFAQCRLGRRGIYGTCCKSRRKYAISQTFRVSSKNVVFLNESIYRLCVLKRTFSVRRYISTKNICCRYSKKRLNEIVLECPEYIL